MGESKKRVVSISRSHSRPCNLFRLPSPSPIRRVVFPAEPFSIFGLLRPERLLRSFRSIVDTSVQCYFFDSDIGNYHYGPGQSSGPDRTLACPQLTASGNSC